MHPYTIEGGVAEVTLRVLLRDFETARLDELAALLERIAAECRARSSRRARSSFAASSNIATWARLVAEPRAVAFAEEALRRLGRTPLRTIVRGGTDGSRLTELGLPTPNLSVGQHNPHSPLEWACLEEMVAAGEMLVDAGAVCGREAEVRSDRRARAGVLARSVRSRAILRACNTTAAAESHFRRIDQL